MDNRSSPGQKGMTLDHLDALLLPLAKKSCFCLPIMADTIVARSAPDTRPPHIQPVSIWNTSVLYQNLHKLPYARLHVIHYVSVVLFGVEVDPSVSSNNNHNAPLAEPFHKSPHQQLGDFNVM